MIDSEAFVVMSIPAHSTIHIPEGINFQCSGCGNCCLSWPVPLTGEDVSRIQILEPSEQAQFRVLREGDRKGTFTHSLGKREDGRCQFLTRDNLCRLHQEHGPEAKPAMCRLFPYTFTPTPSGVFASLSFASSAVLYNTGEPLSEQQTLLQQQWQLLQQLMPGYQPDWHSIQLVDGVPMAWDHYLAIENEILPLFSHVDNFNNIGKTMNEAVLRCRSRVPNGIDLERNLTDARPIVVDQILLRALLDFYFPANVFEETSTDLAAREIAESLVKPPHSVRLRSGEKEFSVSDIVSKRLVLNKDSLDLLRRFIVCRIWSKLYFGPGFNNLSLIAGLNHLLLVVSLIMIQVKLMGPSEDQFQKAAELVRLLERRLTVSSFGRESTVIVEVLLSSPERIQRILNLAT